jgi:hypothetical protein
MNNDRETDSTGASDEYRPDLGLCWVEPLECGTIVGESKTPPCPCKKRRDKDGALLGCSAARKLKRRERDALPSFGLGTRGGRWGM